jgi:hypothetical protein
MDDVKGCSRDQNSGSENLKSLEYYKLNLLLVLYFYGQLSLSLPPSQDSIAVQLPISFSPTWNERFHHLLFGGLTL